ncbi:SH3 domain-containing protein [Actinomycetes bacterium NPDC127524]
MAIKKIIPLALGFSLLTTAGLSPLENLFEKTNTIGIAEAAFSKFSGQVTASALNVRSTTSSKSKAIGLLEKNAKVSVIGSRKGWYKIIFGKGYGYVSSAHVKKTTTSSTKTLVASISNIPGAPKASQGYYLPTNSYVLPVDMVKINKIRVTNTWSASTKAGQLKSLATTLGLPYENCSIFFERDNIKNPNSIYDQVVVYQEFYSSSTMGFGFDNHRGIRKPEGEYLLKVMLKPYFPKSHKISC